MNANPKLPNGKDIFWAKLYCCLTIEDAPDPADVVELHEILRRLNVLIKLDIIELESALLSTEGPFALTVNHLDRIIRFLNHYNEMQFDHRTRDASTLRTMIAHFVLLRELHAPKHRT